MAPDGYFKVNVKTHVESWNLPLPEGCPEAFEEHGAFPPPLWSPAAPKPPQTPLRSRTASGATEAAVASEGEAAERAPVSAGSCAATCLPAGSA